MRIFRIVSASSNFKEYHDHTDSERLSITMEISKIMEANMRHSV